MPKARKQSSTSASASAGDDDDGLTLGIFEILNDAAVRKKIKESTIPRDTGKKIRELNYKINLLKTQLEHKEERIKSLETKVRHF